MTPPKSVLLKHHQTSKCLALLACLNIISLISTCALAGEDSKQTWLPEQLQFHTFGTLGASYHNEKGLIYRRNTEQKSGVQANQLNFSSDSVLGGQADLLINDQFSSSLQLVSRNNSKDNWKPELITGFIRYAPSEKLQFRLGRMTTPSNIGAETRYASYAYTEIRPSQDVYGLFSSYDRYDGIDIKYTKPFLTGIASVFAGYGKTVGETYLGGVSSNVKNTTNSTFTLSWQKDNFEVRGLLSVHNAKKQAAYSSFSEALDATPFPIAKQRAAEIRNAEDFKVYICGISARYTFDGWKIQGVLGKSYLSDYNKANVENGSILVTHRFGQLTPYAIIAYSNVNTTFKPTGVPNLNAQLLALNTAYNNATTLYNTKQNTLSLGLRYDFGEYYAIKTQIDKITADSNPIIISSSPPGGSKDLTLFTIALDFLF